jgi:UDP-GlcNAc:undecaprenyl-phosphate/decaprenyl-phosphate GlcNAc-1-phosphate transferase
MSIFIISFFLTLILMLVFLKTSLSNFALDKPNERSLHANLTPRTGGLALIIGVVITWIIGQVDYRWILLVTVLVCVSLIDDVRGLSVSWRLLVQLLVSVCFVCFFLPNLLSSTLVWWLMPSIVFGLVWMTNLYNFMDGSDGLAGGMGAFGFSSYALASYWAGDAQLAMMCACVAVSCLAFLVYNFHPAKIFMGDSGSIPLGFLAGAIGLHGLANGHWGAWFPLLVFSPFVVDASVTLFRRLLRGEKLSEAHRSHYYQRLVQLGWGHKNTAIAEYVLMFMACFSAILMLKVPLFWICFLLTLWVIIYLVLMLKIDKLWKQRLTSQ